MVITQAIGFTSKNSQKLFMLKHGSFINKVMPWNQSKKNAKEDL